MGSKSREVTDDFLSWRQAHLHLPSSRAVADVFARTKKELGTPTVLVYNAGAFQMGGILEITPEDFERCWRANCLGAFLCAREALPSMLEAGAGTILFSRR